MSGSHRADRALHGLRFDTSREAAAFVAALSRVLAGPRRGAAAPVPEVWCARHATGAPVEILLNDAALAAAESVFAPVPATRLVRGDTLASSDALVIGAGALEAWGVDEAERRLHAAATDDS